MFSFFYFQYGFRFSWSTADLLKSEATGAVALDISKAFDRVRHAGLSHRLKFCLISGHIFGLVSSFLSTGQLCMVFDGNFFARMSC